MFSYEEYKEMIRLVKSTGLAADYRKALGQHRFIIVRHDVEYSVERAYALSRVEEGMDFTSDYFFQWTNPSYNILAKSNLDMVRDMRERGHRIGLHFALNGLTDTRKIKRQIKQEINSLSEMLGFQVDRFSIHRPSKDVLRANIKMSGALNAYQDDFFTFSETIGEEDILPVKYMSDANHIWRYGYPDEKNIKEHAKIQILTHPFAWTKTGYNNFDNYKTLVQEKYQELVGNIDQECKDFGEYKDYFLSKAANVGK